MPGKPRLNNPVPVSDLAAAVLDPVLRRRAGMSVGLVQSWEEIAGPRLAARSRPEKIQWPRRSGEDEPFEPATLVIAADGVAALHLQHETGEILARVNAFLGFAAIGRVRIVQKPVAADPGRSRPMLRELTATERTRLSETVSGIDDDGLREALQRLGATIVGRKR